MEKQKYINNNNEQFQQQPLQNTNERKPSANTNPYDNSSNNQPINNQDNYNEPQYYNNNNNQIDPNRQQMTPKEMGNDYNNKPPSSKLPESNKIPNPEGAYPGYEELGNLDFNDPNFDYNKYDEIMQKYAKEYMINEEGKKNETNENIAEISQKMQGLNINNPNAGQDEENKRVEYLKNEEASNQYYQQMLNQQNQETGERNQLHLNNAPYNDEINKEIRQPETSKLDMPKDYPNNINSAPRGQTPKSQFENAQMQQKYYQQQGQGQTYGQQNYNPYPYNEEINNAYSQNQGNQNNNQQQNYRQSNQNQNQGGQYQARSSSQNPNRGNPQTYNNDVSKITNNYQYTQMNYLKNKANNQVSSITNSNYNFEKVNTRDQRNNYNTVNPIINNNVNVNQVKNVKIEYK
jgi:hypothetical protein